jgi:pimeloyl-ACP methyl ester carboxylesterase
MTDNLQLRHSLDKWEYPWKSTRTLPSTSPVDRLAFRRQVLHMIWRARVGDAEQRAVIISTLEKTLDPVLYEEWASQGGWIATAWIARVWRLACSHASSKSFREAERATVSEMRQRARRSASSLFGRAVVESLSQVCSDSTHRAARLLLRHAPSLVERSIPHLLEFARQLSIAPLLLEMWTRRTLMDPTWGLFQASNGSQLTESDPAFAAAANRGQTRKFNDDAVFDALRETLERILQTDSSSMQRTPLFPDDTDGLLALPTETPQQEYARLLASACVRRGDTRAIKLLLEQLDQERHLEESMQTLALLAEWRQKNSLERPVADPFKQKERGPNENKEVKPSHSAQTADLLRMEIAKQMADRFSTKLAHRFPEWIRILCQWRCDPDHTLLQACAVHALENACEESAGAAQTCLEPEVYLLAPRNTMARATATAVDVVFLHGLRGDPLLTWRCGAFDPSKPNEDDLTEAPVQTATVRKNMNVWREHLWPSEWLARDLRDCARILSVGYSSALTSWGGSEAPNASLSLREQAAEVRRKLLSAGVGKRPLIIIAHSYGGLIAKQLLVDDVGASGTAPDPSSRGRLARALRGIVFYSTPHHGSAVAGKFLGGILYKAVRPAMPVRELLPYNESIEKLHSAFLTLIRHPCRQLGDERGRNRLPGMLWGLWLTAIAGQHDGGVALNSTDTSSAGPEWTLPRTDARSRNHSTSVEEPDSRHRDLCHTPSRRRLLRERGDQIMDALGPVSVGPEFVHGLLRDDDDDDRCHARVESEDSMKTNVSSMIQMQPDCSLPPVHVLSICEGVPTKTWGGGRFLFVTEESAYAGVGKLLRIDHADHLQVCKPPSHDDMRYRSVLGMIKTVAEETAIWCEECSEPLEQPCSPV